MSDWKEIVTLSPEEKKKIKYNDPRLDAFAAEVEARYELPSGLLAAVKNHGERSNTTQVSQKGAKGVMQFIDSTRKSYEHDPNDPLSSIDAAGKYLKNLLKWSKGDIPKALAGYNWGQGNVSKKGLEKAPKETKDYVSRILPAVKGYVDGATKQIDWKTVTPEMVTQAFNFIPKKGQKPAPKIDWMSLSDETLSALPQSVLLAARDQVGEDNKPAQNRLSKFEHKAFAREQVYNDLGNIPGMVSGTLQYSAGKLVGLLGGRSEASLEQLSAGFEGIAEGISKRMQERRIKTDEEIGRVPSGKEGAI